MVDDSRLRFHAECIEQRISDLAKCTDSPDGLQRVFCSPAMRQAHALLRRWMGDAGLVCHVDAVGNLIGRSSSEPTKPYFMIGSHLDTVINAGRYDGMLGVLLGLSAVEVLRELRIETRFGLQIVGFSEEEGVRFRFPFIGSRGITGTLTEQDFERVDDDGIRLDQALAQFGCIADQWQTARCDSSQLIGFMEAHIEQGVGLEEAGLPVGIVTAIAGQTRATIEMSGVAGHAGTVPHHRRQDALTAAAELILEIERLGRQTDGLFATVGSLKVEPGLTNVICGLARFRLDLRHEDDEVRMKAFSSIENSLQEIASKRGVSGTFTACEHIAAVPMDGRLSENLENAIIASGLTPKRIVSGAGHDAMVMARATPSCMLFVRCGGGVSHHPDECVSVEDIQFTLRVMVGALLEISDSYKRECVVAD